LRTAATAGTRCGEAAETWWGVLVYRDLGVIISSVARRVSVLPEEGDPSDRLAAVGDFGLLLQLGVYTEAFGDSSQFAGWLRGVEAVEVSYFFGCAMGVRGVRRPYGERGGGAV
jgi:hypothetical protein